MNLIDVYSAPEAARVLFNLLGERDAHVNISHKAMPTWDEHIRFVASKPYQAWYLIEINPSPAERPPVTVGSLYLTKQREVGLFIFKAHRKQGFGKQALAELRLKHPGKLLANIAPENQHSQRFFQAQGFRHIQNTYEA